jgi:membrane protein YqaA with SNARE-associated domain
VLYGAAAVPDHDEDLIIDALLIQKAALGLVAILALAGLCGFLLQGPIEAGAGWFVDRFGLPGIFLGVLFTDSSIIPMTHEPVLLLGISGKLPTWPLLATASSASVIAGFLGYSLGFFLVGRTRLRPFVERKWPQFAGFVKRYGAKGVAVAALLPIPFAVATWSAGMMGVPFGQVAAASLLRIPKTAFYFFLLLGTWAGSTS